MSGICGDTQLCGWIGLYGQHKDGLDGCAVIRSERQAAYPGAATAASRVDNIFRLPLANHHFSSVWDVSEEHVNDLDLASQPKKHCYVKLPDASCEILICKFNRDGCFGMIFLIILKTPILLENCGTKLEQLLTSQVRFYAKLGLNRLLISLWRGWDFTSA